MEEVLVQMANLTRINERNRCGRLTFYTAIYSLKITFSNVFCTKNRIDDFFEVAMIYFSISISHIKLHMFMYEKLPDQTSKNIVENFTETKKTMIYSEKRREFSFLFFTGLSHEISCLKFD